MTTSKRSVMTDVLERAHALKPLGWVVVTTKAGATIHSPEGGTVGLHLSGGSDSRTPANLEADLKRIGFPAACRKLETQKRAAARSTTAAGRAKTANALARVKPGVAAVFSSAGTDDVPRPSVVRGMQSRVENITPKRAQELLDRAMTVTLDDGTQLRQRNIVEDDVKNWVKVILDPGAWLVMPDGISVAADGSLLNGRHRLTAVVRAGISVDFYVHYNVPPATFAAFDTGRRRTAGDTLKMAGFDKNVLALTSAAKLLVCYDDWLADPAGFPQWSTWSRLKYTNAEVLGSVHRYRDLMEDVNHGQATGARSGLVAASIAAFRQLARRAWPEGEDLLTDFCWGLRTGEDIHRGDPPYTLREWALRTPARSIFARREANLLLLLKCWAAFAANKPVGGIPKHDVGQAMPVPYVPRGQRRASDTAA